MSTEGINYYERLGVAEDATQEEIQAAYKELAKQLHPDNKSDAYRAQFDGMMAGVNEAYGVLRDPEKRAAHNLELRRQREQGEREAETEKEEEAERERQREEQRRARAEEEQRRARAEEEQRRYQERQRQREEEQARTAEEAWEAWERQAEQEEQEQQEQARAAEEAWEEEAGEEQSQQEEAEMVGHGPTNETEEAMAREFVSSVKSALAAGERFLVGLPEAVNALLVAALSSIIWTGALFLTVRGGADTVWWHPALVFLVPIVAGVIWWFTSSRIAAAVAAGPVVTILAGIIFALAPPFTWVYGVLVIASVLWAGAWIAVFIRRRVQGEEVFREARIAAQQAETERQQEEQRRQHQEDQHRQRQEEQRRQRQQEEDEGRRGRNVAGARGESKVNKRLISFADSGQRHCYVFANLYDERLGNIDHVVVFEGGVMVLETKSNKGQVILHEDGSLTYDGGKPFSRDPFAQADMQLNAIKERIGARSGSAVVVLAGADELRRDPRAPNSGRVFMVGEVNQRLASMPEKVAQYKVDELAREIMGRYDGTAPIADPF